MVDVNTFVRNYANAIIDGEAAVFAGAGVSMASGFPNWGKLVEPLAREIGIDVKCESDYIALAQYFVNSRRSRWGIEHLIRQEFAKPLPPSDDLKKLAQMPIDTYWTTNYDPLIETALRGQGKSCDSVDSEKELSSLVPMSDAVVYKMHGDARHPNSCVITKDDYEAYSTTHELFISHLKTALTSKTFLFVGYSFGDPNFEAVLARIRQVLNGSVRTHYYLTKKVKRGKLSKKEFEYKKKQQRMFLDDLARYGIQAVLLDSYKEISHILDRVNRLVKCKTVFISGSAAEYGEMWDKDAVSLVYKLTSALLEGGFRIITGHGQGVGSYVISTAITMLTPEEFDERLVIRAIPYEEKDHNDSYEQMMIEYRRAMTENAGIGIFLFGNKWIDGEICVADGVKKEYELMCEQGKPIIPVPSTGYAAREIYDSVQSDGVLDEDENKILKALVDEYDPNEVVKKVMAIVWRILNREPNC